MLITTQMACSVEPTLNNGCPFRWPNVDTRLAIVGPTSRHYVGPTYVNVNYNVVPTLALHDFNIGQT